MVPQLQNRRVGDPLGADQAVQLKSFMTTWNRSISGIDTTE